MRRYIKALLLSVFLGALARADEPVKIFISNDGVTIAGVAYKSRAEAMVALKNLNPKEVRFVPASDTSYEAVSATLEAYQKAGINAFTGVVGYEKE